MNRVINTASDMEIFAGHVAAQCPSGFSIALHGDLGAGKTVFCRGFLRALGYQGPVKSPTYTLIESYTLDNLTVHHLDLYRITDPQELFFIGISDVFNAQSITLIEWPVRGQGVLPPCDIALHIALQGMARNVALTAHTEQGKHMLARMLTLT